MLALGTIFALIQAPAAIVPVQQISQVHGDPVDNLKDVREYFTFDLRLTHAEYPGIGKILVLGTRIGRSHRGCSKN
jgi:hypothetical protein